MIRQEDEQPDEAPRVVADRCGDERTRPGLIEAALAEPSTRVLVVHGDAAPLAAPGALQWVRPSQVTAGAPYALLGRDGDGAALLVAAVAAAPEEFPAPAGWGSLRTVAAALTAGEADVLVEAVSLARWLVDSGFCPACGAAARLVDAGWARRCPACDRQHFPRTDPAVIVAITHPTDPDLLLLGRNALWPGERYSCFAGFVEAGESLETTVHRELLEEAGVQVRAARYRGSQMWPYPRSLMVGFLAEAVDPDSARPDGVEIIDVRWFTRDEIGAALRGEASFGLPGPASIAAGLIAQWHAEPVA